jgi:hypothetical protein
MAARQRESEKPMFTSHQSQGNALVAGWAMAAYHCRASVAAGRA